jgi:hypothetical protein
VQPEPWHLSHAAVAQAALEQFSLKVLRGALAAAGIEGYAAVERQLPEILERYVRNVDAPPARALSAAAATRPA